MASNVHKLSKASFRLLAAGARTIIPWSLRGLFSTIRLTCLDPELDRQAMSQPIIGATWHSSLLTLLWYFRARKILIMVSRSRDGELVTRVLHRMGFATVRGSSSRGGVEALRGLIRRVSAGQTSAFLVDGPRGPARRAKIGVIVAARETGRPIYPGIAVPESFIRLKSWDRTEIPLPWSRVVFTWAPPILVPRDADRDECERIRERLDATMFDLERRAQAWLAQTRS